MSHEGPDRDQVGLELIGNMDHSRCESTDECYVECVAVVGREISDDVGFAAGDIQSAQLDIIIAMVGAIGV